MTLPQGPVPPAPTERVAAVIVTYERRALLLESLAAVYSQSRVPDAVVVVDNASTDGSADAVRADFPRASLVVLGRNTGGAGGFTVGLARALADGADLAWLMDDDTVPEPGALAALLAARAALPGPRRPAAVASRVVWHDGRAHPMNTPRPKPLARAAERRAAAEAGCIPIRSASFVSLLVDASVVRRTGLPEPDYFLWNDDFEFTARLLRRDVGLLCPASVVVHKTRTFGSTDVDPGDRFFYEVRNKVWTLRSRGAFAPLERALYAGSTVRRWARTIARSQRRRVLAGALARGVAAGVRTAPRPAGQVLAGLPVPAVLPGPRGSGG